MILIVIKTIFLVLHLNIIPIAYLSFHRTSIHCFFDFLYNRIALFICIIEQCITTIPRTGNYRFLRLSIFIESE